MLAAALAAMVEVAWAEDDASRAALSHAIGRYLDGDAAGARAEIQALLALGPDLPPDVRREALLWLGDLLYTEGGAAAARNMFEALLAEAPDYPIDPFTHSPAVVAYFEEVRESLRAPPPRLPPDEPLDLPEPGREPWPWRAAVPGGVGYFIDGKPVAGTITGGLQLAGLGLSIATYIQLRETYPNGGEFPEENPAALEEFRTLLWVNRGAVAVAWLSYLTPLVVETGGWAGKRRLSVAVGPTTVTFSGRF